jgi:hypothetical protein
MSKTAKDKRTSVMRFIDTFPSVCGVIFAIGVLTADGHSTIGPIIMYVSAAATLVTATVSVIRALAQRRFAGVHFVNAFWSLATTLFWVWTVYVLLTFRFVF